MRTEETSLGAIEDTERTDHRPGTKGFGVHKLENALLPTVPVTLLKITDTALTGAWSRSSLAAFYSFLFYSHDAGVFLKQ